MKKNKIFVACDSANIPRIKTIINRTKNSKIKVGYKFGLEFLNSRRLYYKKQTSQTLISRSVKKSNKKIEQLVLHQAKLANKAKLDALVCSAHEVKIVKSVFKKEIITPGIRFNPRSDDQKRVLTPNQAYNNGSDWLVIGRPLTKGNIKKNMQMLIDHLSQ